MNISLRDTIFRILDGYSGAGAVNNASGYAIGLTTMVVDGFGANKALAVGDLFTLTGDPTEYEITAHTETSGTTTSITFTPGLVNAATDNEVITVLPHRIEIELGDGNFTYEEKRPITYKKNRGRLDTVREGDAEPIDVSFDFLWKFLKSHGSEPVTIEEALKRKGAASAWVSASADPCEPYAVDLEIEFTPPCVTTAGIYAERILIQDFRYESLAHDPKTGQIAAKGSANVEEAVLTRFAAA